MRNFKFLYRNPNIIYSWSGLIDEEFRNIVDYLRSNTAYFIITPSYYVSDHRIENYARLINAVTDIDVRKHVILLSNSLDEYNRTIRANIRTAFVNQNAFIDNGTFHILHHIEKKYDAIYNARFTPIKNHHLASEVNNLACLCWGFFRKELEYNYYLSIKDKFILLNEFQSETELERKTPQEVNYIYNESHVGLCLSNIEGAMFVSTEYLLAGLPVVSTKSVGGRDVFFTENNSIVVENNPTEVANAVLYWTTNYSKIDREKIRSDTIAKQKEHIKTFQELIKSILYEHGIMLANEQWWSKTYNHKLIDFWVKDFPTFIKKKS